MKAERQRWWRGLVARVTLVFAVGSLLLSVVVATAAYTLALGRLLSDAETQHQTQTYANYREVRQRLDSLDALPADAPVEDVDATYRNAMSGLSTPNGGQAILDRPDGEPVSSESLTLRDLPPEIRSQIRAGLSPAQQRYTKDGELNYVFGIALDELDAYYFEVVGLSEQQSTLSSLRTILFGVALFASMFGGVLGYYSAKAALRPLPRISGAARAIAAGEFDTKLDMQADPDLAVLTTAFNNMVDAVGDRIEREQRFTSDVSHELRSPLMTVTASVEVLERRKESLPEVAQQAVDLLSSDLRRFQRLVEDLLEISRLEAGAVQLQLSRFVLSEFMNNVIAQSRSPHLELAYDPATTDLAITADKRRLQQVMTNLIENADKYGGGATSIGYQVAGSSVQIVIEDEGAGVPADQRERIFERFGRGRESAGNRSDTLGFG